MHARVTTLEVPPDGMDDATRHVREQVLPRLSRMEGFEGFVVLGSGQGGKLQGVAFWESEEARRATDTVREATDNLLGSGEAALGKGRGQDRRERKGRVYRCRPFLSPLCTPLPKSDVPRTSP